MQWSRGTKLRSRQLLGQLTFNALPAFTFHVWSAFELRRREIIPVQNKKSMLVRLRLVSALGVAETMKKHPRF